ncbi:hypothetical protein N781_09040 [Pontibacillus halophilus JSM 076056 = DSM 19796]|uniref:Uncharacterized protein n=1 Tax=Pontibacillus halophilus JSM 076056 = DSM 19796 TaxID=1385510 RepID=A0A0A5GF64_9BACI|nr:hypothetical protein [Pontibacillus halophilus]KGX89853.1 hypothetical protein N781_09040 [Pontibacillus halophilus JSM 076056 = DSM 19796]
MRDTHQLTVTDRLLPYESQLYKEKELISILEEIQVVDEQWLSLIRDMFVEESQKGDIVEAMMDLTDNLSSSNKLLVEAIEVDLSKTIRMLDQQVDRLKEQRMTLTYEEQPRAF